ncbi:hypothetical protein IRY31_10150 [Corynebacterium afermentans subsp. lipophilum]|uniref:hypothetical protein n=1 Tax=Corynebacterium afermentans TaxID=38286 RepID=UPI00188A5F9D|nr:hypothetical protein [Corynebacterium afermentans]MBF4548421.1 hypothetical protein [Corynebacterium afermentans subsp. lipophilum]WJY58814.1 hypothetical protein CAFEL_05210 [Corynebacterium afermentans subsp. lipophilum]
MTRKTRRITTALLGALMAGAAIAPANATTLEESAPETPANNDKLPIVHTYRGSDHLKANVLNPRPVCNSTEDYRTVVYKVKDNFLPVGTISTTNLSDEAIPLQQDLSRTQTVSASVNGSKTETLDLGGSGSKKGIEGNIGYSLAKSLGWDVSAELSWNVGQTVGPYDVPAGNTGEATYGFRTVTMTGTQQRCRPNGTWATPTAWVANMPVKNEVRVKNFDTPADSWAPNKGAQTTEVKDEPNAEYDKDVDALNKGDNIDDVEKVDDNKTADVSNEDVNLAADNENAAKEESEKADESTTDNTEHDLDLEPYFTVSSAKAKGFAGSTALRVKNVGNERYWGEFPAVTFRVAVRTEDGPEGVDRLITTTTREGGYAHDLGWDEDEQARIFEVTLSNPINPGEEADLVSFSFGDGNTKEGRLTNYITVTQTGRLDGDDSEYNDQDVDSRDVTLDDFGRENEGIF